MNRLAPGVLEYRVRQEFWSIPTRELLEGFATNSAGLATADARARLSRYGPNRLHAGVRTDILTIFLRQFKSPVILVLIFAAVLSSFLHDLTDAFIILGIIAISALLGFWQERGASQAVERLLAVVQVKSTVLRDGEAQEVPMEEVMPGDVVLVSAGDTLPGDCLLLESKDLAVNEAALTGETFSAEKAPGVLPADTHLARRSNCLFLGTHVVSGTGKAVVVHTGKATEFGSVSERLRLRPPETDFERGLRHFGYLLMQVTLLLVVGIFAANVFLNRPILDSFLFSLALAVGLTPELLPAIVTSNLAYGAKRLANRKVIVRRMASIENFGSMDVLCSDKTGTLTQGVVRLRAAENVEGRESDKVLLFAYLNATFQSGFENPIDEAIKAHLQTDLSPLGLTHLSTECPGLPYWVYFLEGRRRRGVVDRNEPNQV